LEEGKQPKTSSVMNHGRSEDIYEVHGDDDNDHAEE